MLKALRESLEEFHKVFKGLTILTKMMWDKIFLAMSYLYLFILSRGIQVDFSIAFHPVLVLDFTVYSKLRPLQLDEGSI
jgi:hypothetical protein